MLISTKRIQGKLGTPWSLREGDGHKHNQLPFTGTNCPQRKMQRNAKRCCSHIKTSVHMRVHLFHFIKVYFHIPGIHSFTTIVKNVNLFRPCYVLLQRCIFSMFADSCKVQLLLFKLNIFPKVWGFLMGIYSVLLFSLYKASFTPSCWCFSISHGVQSHRTGPLFSDLNHFCLNWFFFLVKSLTR